MDKSLRSDIADVSGADELEFTVRRERRFPHGREHLALEVRRKILHEGDGAKDSVAHLPTIARGGFEMFLDIVLADEMRDVGRDRLPAALGGREDEVSRVVGERGVDQGFALLFFCLDGGAAAEEQGDAEDAPDRGVGGLEDGGAVAEVAFDDLDVLGFLGEGGGGGGGRVAG